MAELTKNVLGFEEFVQLPDEVKAQAIQTGFIDNEYIGGSDDMTEPEFDMTDTEDGEGGMDYEFDITTGDEEGTDDFSSDEEGEGSEGGEEGTDDFSFGEEEGEGSEDSGIEDLDSEEGFSSDEEGTDDFSFGEEGEEGSEGGEEGTDDFSFGEEEEGGSPEPTEEEGSEEEEETEEEEEEEEAPAPKKAPKK